MEQAWHDIVAGGRLEGIEQGRGDNFLLAGRRGEFSEEMGSKQHKPRDLHTAAGGPRSGQRVGSEARLGSTKVSEGGKRKRGLLPTFRAMDI